MACFHLLSFGAMCRAGLLGNRCVAEGNRWEIRCQHLQFSKHGYNASSQLMFGIRPRLPISEEDRQWTDNGFDQLSRLLGHQRMLHAKVVLPDAEHFPDRYDRSIAAAEKMFCRVCEYMDLDRRRVDFEVFPDATDELRDLVPYWQSSQGGCAGLYVHPEGEKDRMVVALRQSQMEDPLAVVATLAHELGHVILLGGGLLERGAKDMEPLTDLLTVFLGFGVFNANCAARFRQWQNNQCQGWSMQRLGYLPEEIYGYALARFAQERSEQRPPWASYLSTNVRSYFKGSLEWLQAENKRAKGAIT